MTTGVTCREGVGIMMDYLEGLLPPARRQAVESHVADCPRCVAFVRSYSDTPRIFRAATDTAMPEAMAEALRRFLSERL